MTSATRKQSIWIRIAKRLVVYTLLVASGLYIVFYFNESGLIFLTNNQMGAEPSARGWDFEAFALPVGGETTHGWYIPLVETRGVVLYSHGNDSNISTCLGPAALFREMGFSVVLYDYGGYGESTGEPSEGRMYADALAVWDWITNDKGVSPSDIILWGPSFGGGPTCELATRVSPAAVVLENTFSSMADAAFKDYPWFPGGLFLHQRFDNKEKIGRIDTPLLVIHSRGDQLYPYSQGELLFDGASEPKQFLEVFGDHGEGAIVSKDVFVAGVETFLERIGKGRDAT